MSTTVIPPGFAPALHPITPWDHGGYATIASGCGLVFVLLFAIIRLFNSRRIGFFLSDHALLAGTALTIVQSILIFLAVDEGLGKFENLVEARAKDSTMKLIYASGLLYILALFLSKISLLYLLWRLSVEITHVRLARWSVGITIVAMIASVLIIAFGCDVKRPWDLGSEACGSLETRWIVVEALGLLAELFISILVCRIYHNLQKSWRWKVRSLCVFALRVCTIPLAILRLGSLRNSHASENLLFTQVATTAWTQTALAYSIATATIPCLMAFMIKLNTGWGAFSPETVMEQSQQDSKSFAGHQYELRNLQSSQRKQSVIDDRIDDVNYKWAISSRKAEERSIASDDSRNMIIRKTVEFSSETERGQ